MKSGLPGESKALIKQELALGSASPAELAERVGSTPGNISRHLAHLLADGEVTRVFENRTFVYSLAGEQVNVEPEPEKLEPQPVESERVKLAEELVEIERMIIDASVRRAEILEMLR